MHPRGSEILAPPSKDTQNRASAPEKILLFLSRPIMRWPTWPRDRLTPRVRIAPSPSLEPKIYFAAWNLAGSWLDTAVIFSSNILTVAVLSGKARRSNAHEGPLMIEVRNL